MKSAPIPQQDELGQALLKVAAPTPTATQDNSKPKQGLTGTDETSAGWEDIGDPKQYINTGDAIQPIKGTVSTEALRDMGLD